MGDDEELMANACKVFNRRQEQITDNIRRQAGLPKNAQGYAQAILILQQTDVNAVWSAAIESPDSLHRLLAKIPLAPPIIAGPALSRSTLGPPQIDFGAIEETTNTTLAMLNRWPKVRFAGFLTILAGITAFIVTTAR